jgi:hypothetical protein
LGLEEGLVGLAEGLEVGLLLGLISGLVWEKGAALLSRWSSKRSALSSRLTFAWPSSRQQRHGFLRRAGRGLISGLFLGLFLGLFVGLVETRPVLITSQTPTEAESRSLITALVWGLITVLITGLLVGLGQLVVGLGQRLVVGLEQWQVGLVLGLGESLFSGLVSGLFLGLFVGLFVGLNNGGWFVLLQKVAHRRLARGGNFPPRPYDFLEWGIEKQIFRRVGGGVRFRHNLIQQQLANTSEGVGE